MCCNVWFQMPVTSPWVSPALLTKTQLALCQPSEEHSRLSRTFFGIDLWTLNDHRGEWKRKEQERVGGWFAQAKWLWRRLVVFTFNDSGDSLSGGGEMPELSSLFCVALTASSVRFRLPVCPQPPPIVSTPTALGLHFFTATQSSPYPHRRSNLGSNTIYRIKDMALIQKSFNYFQRLL